MPHERRIRRTLGAAILAGLLLLVSCNGAPPTDGGTPTGPPQEAQGKVQPTLDSPAPTSTPTQDGVEIEIEDGQVIGPLEIGVDAGETMTLEIKADVEDRVHIHGYEVFADIGPDQDALIQFQATLPGVFDIELEDSGLHITKLRVKR